MGMIKKTTVLKNPKGGGTTHIPSAVMSQYDLNPGDILEWWPTGKGKEIPAEADDLIGLKIIRRKRK